MTLLFRPVNLQHDLELFSNLRTNANLEVIGYSSSTPEKFQKYIEKNLALLGTDAFWHAYENDRLVAQLELGSKHDDGYVHLFYILPEYRGLGYFKQLHNKMLQVMRQHKFKNIRLSTPPSNTKAIQIYQNYGWVNNGPDPDKDGMVIFCFKDQATEKQ